MIVLSGNQEAWRTLPRDVPQRFARNVTECRGFEFDEAASLLYVGLHPHDGTTSIAEHDDDDLWPLTVTAVRAIHLQTRGNPRGLFQLASQAFRAAAPEEKLIDEDVVRGVLRGAGEAPVEPSRVLADVRRLAAAEGFSVEEPASNGRSAIHLRLGGADRLLLMLGQATHYYDEVLDAGELDAIEALGRGAPGARAMLLVLGYVSPSVRDTLAQAG